MAVHGFVTPKFERMLYAFQQNFEEGWESAGAAFAVYHEGQLAVDLYGGKKDTHSKRQWQANTTTTLFSVTKALGALVMAKLVDEGMIGYGDLLTNFWREYATNDKENTTIRHVMLHQAGLPYLSRVIQLNEFNDHRAMGEILQNQTPIWKPGSTTAYHALTIGLLQDQIVRRVDAYYHRSLASYLRQAILAPHGITGVHLGVSKSEERHVATCYDATEEEIQQEILFNPLVQVQLDALQNSGHYPKYQDDFPWLITPLDYNKPANRQLELSSSNGVASARGLAHLFSKMYAYNGDLLSTVAQSVLKIPELANEMDVVNGYELNIGHGFQYTKSPQNRWLIGHSGYGGQNLRIDPKNELVFVYLCNGLKAADGDLVRTFARLQNELYKCL